MKLYCVVILRRDGGFGGIIYSVECEFFRGYLSMYVIIKATTRIMYA